MPLIHRVPKTCLCPGKPATRDLGAGSIWECDNQECRRQYILVEIDEPLETVRYWREYGEYVASLEECRTS